MYELSINIRIDNSLKIKLNNSNIFNFETDKEKKIERKAFRKKTTKICQLLKEDEWWNKKAWW